MPYKSDSLLKSVIRMPKFLWILILITGFVILQYCSRLPTQPISSFTCPAIAPNPEAPQDTSNAVHLVNLSPDGKTLIAGCMDGTIKSWNLITGDEIHSFRTQPTRTSDIHWETKVLASNDTNNAIRLWSLQTGKAALTLRGHSDKIYGIAFSPDGKKLVSVADRLQGKVWDLATGQVVRNFFGYEIAFSPDGRILATAGEPRFSDFSPAVDYTAHITLWNFETGKKIRTFHTGHPDMIYSLAFSSDGKTLATGSTNIKTWDVDTGKELRTISAGENTGVSLTITFSPDGKTIARGSNEGLIRVWDLETGQQVHTFSGPLVADPEIFDLPVSRAAIYKLTFSPDGNSLISGGEDGVIRIWRVNPTKLV